MKSVNVYYAGIPAKNTKKEKELVLSNFHAGVGIEGVSKEIRNPLWEPSDLAVIQGWVHNASDKTPHLMFRKNIIENQRKIGKHTLAIDSNLFLYRDPENVKTYLRFSLNDVFPIAGNYFTDKVDPQRWQQIKNDLNIDLKPWRQTNPRSHILICMQRNGGWSMGNENVFDWVQKTVDYVVESTGRMVVLRLHPGDAKTKRTFKFRHPRVIITRNRSILQDLINCHAVITYNSSPGVAAAIEGIPVFVTDPNPRKSQAFDVCNTDLSLLERPIMPDRQKWIEKICMSHFSFEDLRNGTAWNIIKDYI